MKSTGIVRNTDSLGRLVIPKELRKILGLQKCTPMEIFIDKEYIMLKKYEPLDIFTDNSEGLIEYHGKLVSKESITEMAQLVGLI